MSEVFRLRRLWLLMRADFVTDYRADAIVCATVITVMLILSMLTVAQGNETDGYYISWFYGGLFIWGPILASYSFKELHDKTRNEAYLLLPASTFEKLLARLLGTTVVFFAFFLVFLTLASALIEGINWLVFGRRNGLFDASHEAVWAPVGHFIVVVSLYFLGAAWFRKMHFIKTALTLTALPIALACFAAVVVSIVTDDVNGLQVEGRDFYNYYVAHRGVFNALLAALEILYFIGVPIFCWYVAWLRVKETEVSHGV